MSHPEPFDTGKGPALSPEWEEEFQREKRSQMSSVRQYIWQQAVYAALVGASSRMILPAGAAEYAAQTADEIVRLAKERFEGK